MTVGEDFKRFKNSYNMPMETIQVIGKRYRRITRQLNRDFYGTDSETLHSFYVGSYGRDTAAVGLSDLDIGFILPWSVYEQYHKRQHNGQSALLQEVKRSVKRTLPRSISFGDGQVVSLNFGDGMKFEILPVFENEHKIWTYANTKGGGTWKSCNPRAEIEAIKIRNLETNRNLKHLCRMMRVWRDTCKVPLSGILIDTLAYQFIDSCKYSDKSFLYHQYLARDYFEFLVNQRADQSFWRAPGSGSPVYKKGGFQQKAKLALGIADMAIEKNERGFEWARRQLWRRIFGTTYPGQSYRLI